MELFVFFKDRELRNDLKYQLMIWYYQVRPSSKLMARLVTADRRTNEE